MELSHMKVCFSEIYCLVLCYLMTLSLIAKLTITLICWKIHHITLISLKYHKHKYINNNN